MFVQLAFSQPDVKISKLFHEKSLINSTVKVVTCTNSPSYYLTLVYGGVLNLGFHSTSLHIFSPKPSAFPLLPRKGVKAALQPLSVLEAVCSLGTAWGCEPLPCQHSQSWGSDRSDDGHEVPGKPRSALFRLRAAPQDLPQPDACPQQWQI